MIQHAEITFGGFKIPTYSVNTVVVGSGAAGLNCACRLFREMEETSVEKPHDRIVVLTRGIGLGTSYNSGSDKQTYYKLGTHGDEPDIAADFADTLTSGGCMHHDVAMVEGANSLRAFYRLVDLGVPFPHNENGGFVGYKTDNDPRQRGTSAGPWTSRMMVQKLLAELKRCDIKVFDQYYMLAVITEEEEGIRSACGLLCVNLREENAPTHGLTLFNCRNVVVAGGGPGELYEFSVYPEGQMGPYAALFEAGVQACNLTESQFGIASINPRWNLSGTYQQAIPRYFSTDCNGGDEREFLNPWFDSMSTLATDIFLKGYQWPFDHDKITDYGSSLIDILVQNEIVNNGRRVFIDFRENPRATNGLETFSLEGLKPEALDYLKKSGAVQLTPIERLAHMNSPSIDLYKQMGVDLYSQPLEIGVCSQHCNGGFAVDTWWESSVRHLFVIGELAGTHGVKRPGGAALNSGQVGGIRAAERIAHIYYGNTVAEGKLRRLTEPVVDRFGKEIARVIEKNSNSLESSTVKKEIKHRMSRYAGIVRSTAGVENALAVAKEQWQGICRNGLKQDSEGFIEAVEARELALAQIAFLESILAFLKSKGGSRGSYLVTDPLGKLPHPRLDDEWRYLPENEELRGKILGLTYDIHSDSFQSSVTCPNPVKDRDDWFENTWAEYRRAAVFQKDNTERPRPYKIYQKQKPEGD